MARAPPLTLLRRTRRGICFRLFVPSAAGEPTSHAALRSTAFECVSSIEVLTSRRDFMCSGSSLRIFKDPTPAGRYTSSLANGPDGRQEFRKCVLLEQKSCDALGQRLEKIRLLRVYREDEDLDGGETLPDPARSRYACTTGMEMSSITKSGRTGPSSRSGGVATRRRLRR